MKWRSASARRYGLDALLGVAAVAAAVEAALGDAARGASVPGWLVAVAAALVVLPLLARRRLPFAAPVAVWALAVALSFVAGRAVANSTSLFLVGMVASLMLGQLRDAVRGRLGLALVVCGIATVIDNDPSHSASEFVFVPALGATAWLAGAALRARSAQAAAAEERALHAEREREAAARVAVAEERARVARELHDIVAHAVSVMVLQVGAVRHKLPEALGADKEALKGVEQTGRVALGEMRRLLAAMRHDGDDVDLAPPPGLAGLDSLLDAVRRAGLPVRLHVDGEPFPLPRGLDLSVYRIVQEGLTNALKHAHAGQADVVIRYAPRELRVDVRDDGRGPATSDGLGHGLVGVRERVKLYGGEMTAGSANGRGFLLSTRLPLDRDGR